MKTQIHTIPAVQPKSKVRSKLFGCLIKPRSDQQGPMFTQIGAEVAVNLTGYAIVPLEEYEALTAHTRKKDTSVHLEVSFGEAFTFPIMKAQ